MALLVSERGERGNGRGRPTTTATTATSTSRSSRPKKKLKQALSTYRLALCSQALLFGDRCLRSHNALDLLLLFMVSDFNQKKMVREEDRERERSNAMCPTSIIDPYRQALVGDDTGRGVLLGELGARREAGPLLLLLDSNGGGFMRRHGGAGVLFVCF